MYSECNVVCSCNKLCISVYKAPHAVAEITAACKSRRSRSNSSISSNGDACNMYKYKAFSLLDTISYSARSFKLLQLLAVLLQLLAVLLVCPHFDPLALVYFSSMDSKACHKQSKCKTTTLQHQSGRHMS
jgi:hypothetical protein